MSYLDLTLKDIHDAIITNKVTPLELVKEALDRANKDTNNCFEYIYNKEALEQVEALDPSKKDSIFYGVPIVIKDNYSTKDIPTTASSNILNGYVPIFDATVVSKLKESGAIIIAKTTMDELAMGGSGTTGHLGKTTNPYNKDHLIGGSSCGSAAAIASGIVPFALGSDTGDSVRKPASYGGLVGFKPSWGRISRFGLFPFAPSLDHVAYFTRNVYDSAVSLNILAGRDNKDSTSSLKEVKDYTSKLNESLKGKRIAVINGIYNSIGDKDILSTFDKSLERMKSEGAIINYVDVDIDLLKAIFPTYFIISCSEATSNNANLDGIKFGAREKGNSYEEVIINTRTKGFSELIKRRFVIGSYSLLRENRDELFTRAQKCRRLIVNAINDILKDNDAIYLPSAPTVAPTFTNNNVDKMSDEYLIADNYMAIGNFGGLPSITIPLGFKDDLPFGGNLTGKAFDEDTLLSIANNLEKITGLSNLIARGK